MTERGYVCTACRKRCFFGEGEFEEYNTIPCPPERVHTWLEEASE